MTTAEIAHSINSQNLYTRGDKAPLEASQVNARIKQYSHLFIVSDGKVYLRH